MRPWSAFAVTASLVVTGLVAGCAGGAAPTAPEPTTGSAAPRSTEAAQTREPTMATSTATPAWDIVLMGDSVLLPQIGVLELRLERDLGVSLVVHDWINPDLAAYEVGGERSGDLLTRLRSDEDLRADLRGAEIVVFDVPVGMLNDLCPDSTEITAEEQERCFEEVVPLYRADADAIFAELVGLRDPADAMTRVTDVWQFLWPTFHRVGDYDIVRAGWQAMNGAVATAAERHAIPLIRAYDEFTGSNGDRDPVAAGDVDPDEVHLTAQGAARFVELVVASGYRPLR